MAPPPVALITGANGEIGRSLLERLHAEFGKTIVMVTHDPKAAARAHRLVHLDKGVLKEDVRAKEATGEIGAAAAAAIAAGK